MARYLAQLIIASTQVIGKAFARAIKQEIEASQQAAQRLGHGKTRSERMANQKLGISLEEAKQILSINELSKEEANKKFDALFKANAKEKGGTFYIQSKIVRAKERIDQEFEAVNSEKKRESEGKT